MKLETCKGEFTGDLEKCVDWLEEMQPAFASVRISNRVETINSDGTNRDEWKAALQAAVKEVDRARVRCHPSPNIDGGQ